VQFTNADFAAALQKRYVRSLARTNASTILEKC